MTEKGEDDEEWDGQRNIWNVQPWTSPQGVIVTGRTVGRQTETDQGRCLKNATAAGTAPRAFTAPGHQIASQAGSVCSSTENDCPDPSEADVESYRDRTRTTLGRCFEKPVLQWRTFCQGRRTSHWRLWPGSALHTVCKRPGVTDSRDRPGTNAVIDPGPAKPRPTPETGLVRRPPRWWEEEEGKKKKKKTWCWSWVVKVASWTDQTLSSRSIG